MAAKKMPGHRAALSDFTINLGFLDVHGDLIAPQETGSKSADQFKLCCPKCSDGTAVKQGYTCENGHGPFLPSECGHAKEVNKALIKVTDEEYEKARTVDLEKSVLSLTVHETVQVQDTFLPSGLTYVIRPTGEAMNIKKFSALVRLVNENPQWTFVGVCNLRNAEKFMALGIGLNGQLLMNELVWPDDLRQHDNYTVPVSDDLLAPIEKSIEVTEFNPDGYVKSTREKIAALVASKTGEERVVDDTDDVDTGEMDDLEAQFRNLLKAA